MWMDIAQQDGDQDPRNSEDEDTVYDRTNPFFEASESNRAGPSSSSPPKNPFHQRESGGDPTSVPMLDERDTRCGLCSWRPHYLQRLANKTVFSVIFTIVGILHSSVWTYYTANISTLEKRFRFNSVTSGVLLISNELAQVLVAVLFTFFNFRKHRAKIMTLGVALSALSCFLMASPHFLLGSGDMSLSLLKQAPGVGPPQTFVAIPDGAGFELQEEEMMIPESLPLVQDQETSNSSIFATSFPSSPSTLVGNTEETSVPTDIITIGDSDNHTNTLTTASSQITSTLPPTSSTSSPNSNIISVTTEGERSTVSHSLMNDEMRSVWPTCRRDVEHISSNFSTSTCDDNPAFERKLAFGFIFTANVIFGIASMFYLISGGPFSEESTIFPNEIPRIFGITMSIRLIGTFFGYLFAWSCLSEFINPMESPIQIDARWLGAYWIGWLCLSIFMAFFALIFSLFPRQSPREFLKKRSLTHDTGLAMLLIPSVASFFGGAELKTANVFPSILNVPGVFQGFYRNRVYLLLTFSTVVHIFVSVGYFTFLPKYLEFMFRLRVNDAAMLTGISTVPFHVAGLMLGGAFIARYLPSSKEISHWSCVVTALQIVSLMIMSFLGCDTTKVDISFLQHQQPGGTMRNGTSSSLGVLHCSGDCDCGGGPPIPACDLYTGTTYYSPCHAGCEEVLNQTGIFSECSCLPSGNATLVEGFCQGDGCGNGLIAFLVFLCLGQFLRGSGVVGRMLLSYKSLQADQRTAIIGLTLMILSLVSVIPSPIVFGSLFESVCLVREASSCSNGPNETGGSDATGNCWLYNDSALRFIYNLGAAAFMVIAFALDALLWKNRNVHELRIYDGELRQLTSQHQNGGAESNNNRFSTVALT